MNTKLKVTALEIAPNNKPFNAGGEFAQLTTLTLEGGKKIPYHITARKKKNIPDTILRAQKCIEARAMSAEFGEDGKLWGVSQKWKIGAGGMVPDGDDESEG
jgi:hypothetical protein